MMPRLSIFLGLFSLFAMTAMGQKTAAVYAKEIDALYLNKDFKPALQLATSWELEAREKFGEHSLER